MHWTHQPPAHTGTRLPDAMAERINAERAADPLCHEWIVAADVPVDRKTARRAALRDSFLTPRVMRIFALEVYCGLCRRPLDEVGDADCEAKIDNTHLIGGDQSTRAKRIHHEPVGTVVKVPMLKTERHGLGGYSVHAGKGRRP